MIRQVLFITLVLSLVALSRAQTTQPALPPQPADVPAMKIDAKTGKTDEPFLTKHGKYVERAKQGDIDLLFVGDSITEQWMNATHGKDVWQKHYGDAYKAANFGVGGDRTQHVLWRMQNGELENIHPKVAVLMIGTNNTNSDAADKIAAGVEKIVKEIRDKTGAKVLLLAVFPRGANPAEEKVIKQRQIINDINATISKLDDGKNVRYLDIGDKFMEGDKSITKEMMPDYLHLSPKGYEIWADAIDPVIKEMMGS